MSACACNETLGNTGITDCSTVGSVTKKVFFVPLIDGLGVENKIDLSLPFGDAELALLVNNTDPLKRWYPTTLIENVDGTRADAVYEPFNSGNKIFVKDGVRTLSFELVKQGAELKAQLDKFACTEMGVYLLDINGNARGIVKGTYLKPIEILALYTQLVMATDTTGEKLKVSFEFKQTMFDADLRLINLGINALNLNGLLSIYSKYSATSTTGFSADLFTAYGFANDKKRNVGLIITDFALYNVTTSTAVIITSVVYNAITKSYVFVIPTQAIGSMLRLTPTKAKFDYTNVIANLITL